MPAALILLGAASVATAGERQVSVRGGKMATRMVNGKMVLTGIQGNVGGGKIHMAGRMAMDSDKTQSATVKFDALSLAQAAKMAGQPNLASFLGNVVVSGFVKGQWQGEGLTEIISSANGSLTVNTGPGTVTDKALLDRLAKLTGIADLPELAYTSMKLKVTAAGGNIVIDSITANGPTFNLTAKGTYVASTDIIDMVVEASVSPEMAAKSSYMKLNNVMGFLRGEEKPESGEFVDIPRMVVSGDLNKPDVKFEQEKVVAAATAEPKEAKPAVSNSVKRVSNFLLSQAK